ncbi:MAG: hypothetical protein SVX38_16810, partial [Chloroflexota bacterium]|nr:hypothetical protein [Chloroflexota bacterium]
LRDDRSRSGSGTYFTDFWTQTMLPPLQGDIGGNRLADLLVTFTRPQFYDADHNYRWLSTDSENYGPDYRFVSGYVMEGGFFNGVPNAVPAVASYQLQQNTQADEYANDFYLDVWARMGPYETMREWDAYPPGMYLETSIYMESLVGTWWLLGEALGLQVDGSTVTVEPRLGGQFVARNVRVTAGGHSVVFDYARDAAGCEFIEIHSNEGLTINAPQVGTCGTFTPTATPTNTPTATPTATATSTNTPTATPTATATSTNTPTATPTATATSTNTPTATPTATATSTNTPTATPTATATPNLAPGGYEIFLPLIVNDNPVQHQTSSLPFGWILTVTWHLFGG